MARVVLCLLTSPLELPCHAGLVKVGIGALGRDAEKQTGGRGNRTLTLAFLQLFFFSFFLTVSVKEAENAVLLFRFVCKTEESRNGEAEGAGDSL